MEKYKKKLQEGADLRQHVKVAVYISVILVYSSYGVSLSYLGFRKAERRPCG
jgi:hypothetical protein